MCCGVGAHPLLTVQALEAGEMPSPLPPLPRDLEAEWGVAGAPAAEPMAALDAFSPASLSPPLPVAHGVANVFSDVPDDLFGASFWCALLRGAEKLVTCRALVYTMHPAACQTPA